jgi:phosphatidyl-myo-inositol alpha-mannosyltransferase
MHTLHLLNGEQYSGLERVVDQLVQAAPEFGYVPHLGLLKPNTMVGRMQSRGIAAHDLQMRSRFDWSVAERTAGLVRQMGLRLIHSHTVRSAMVAVRVARQARVPWIHHVHSCALRESHMITQNLANFWTEKVVLRRSDQIITVSEALADYVARHYGVRGDRVTVVRNGVPSSALPATMARAGAVRTIAVVALFRPRKGLHVLLDALLLLVRAGHRVKLRVVGEFSDAAYEARIADQIHGSGLSDVVDLLGFTSNPSSEYAGCDLVVVPSLYGEGIPMTMLEAMSAARPIVASDIDGIREVLAGGAGILVPSGNPQALADAIAQILRDQALAKSLSEAARNRQITRYDAAQMGAAVYALYDQLTGRR